MSATVSASLIKELRERTGVGMGQCKDALVACNGDIEEAISWLRKKGLASAVKKEGRATNEGMILTAQNGNNVAVVEANAETDFVVRNDKFQDFLKNITEDAAKTAPASLEAFLLTPYSKDSELNIDQYRATLVHAIGENIQVRRVHNFKKDADTSIGIYSHLGGKILTVVVIKGSNSEEQLARDIAMHAAAAAPDFLKPSDVPAATIDSEREIARSQMQGKPDNIVEKILGGKIDAFYDAVCLLRQKYIKDDSKTIQELVDARSKELGKPLEVVEFIRWSVGQ